MKLPVRKITSGVFFGLFGATILLHWYLYGYYGRTRPREPALDFGRTIPLNDHGTIVYLTEGENSLLTWTFFGQFAFGIVGGFFFQNGLLRRR
jgi:hypothetical protein